MVKGDRAADHVLDDRLARQWNRKAPHGRAALGLEPRDVLVAPVAATPHHRRLLVGVRLGTHGVQFLGALPRRVHHPRSLQTVNGLAVDVAALALAERALVPVEPHPLHHTQDLGLALGSRPLAVGVLEAQDERASGVTGRQPVEQRGARASHMQRSSRARREANAQGGGHVFGGF